MQNGPCNALIAQPNDSRAHPGELPASPNPSSTAVTSSCKHEQAQGPLARGQAGKGAGGVHGVGRRFRAQGADAARHSARAAASSRRSAGSTPLRAHPHPQDVEKLASKKGVVLQTIKEVLQASAGAGLCRGAAAGGGGLARTCATRMMCRMPCRAWWTTTWCTRRRLAAATTSGGAAHCLSGAANARQPPALHATRYALLPALCMQVIPSGAVNKGGRIHA